MDYSEDDIERLEYSEQQQCYHRAKINDFQPEGLQTVCIAHPKFIDKFRMAHVGLRGSFTDVQKSFAEFAGPFAMPEA